LADTAFIALYRGRTVGDARLVAVSSEHSIVDRFFAELLGEPKNVQEADDPEQSASILEVVRDE
jgi:hypothetical protein